MKRKKLTIKIHNLANTKEANKMEKQIEEFESKAFKVIKELNKMKLKTRLLTKKKKILTYSN